MNGLLEILTNKYWMIDPNSAHAIRKTLEVNLNGRIPVGQFDKKASFGVSSDGVRMDYLVTDEGESFSHRYVSHIKESFVNILVIDGPVTRNGGACSYGSIDHRDQIIEASNNPHCRGHVFVINTPGGSAWAKNDYQQGIEYARSKGLPVYAFIDGMCASAGMYLAALCDKRFYMHPKNEIGSIGVLCAFYSEKDGSHNAYSNETYHEIYEPDSYDKNKWYRDIVNDGDDKVLVEELVALGKEFRADVKAACPNAKDEHLHGRVFNASEVQGILVDEQSTFGDVVALCFSTYENTHSNSNNSPMDEKYLPLATACGVDELVMTEEGTHLAMPLVDKLTEKLNADAAELANRDQQIADLFVAQNTAVAQLRDEHEKVLADQKAESDATIADLQAQVATLTVEADKVGQLETDKSQALADLNKAQSDLADAQAALVAAQQTIADRDAQIEELTSQPASTPEESPANNGTGAEAAAIDTIPAYDSTLSPEENANRRAEWKAAHGL